MQFIYIILIIIVLAVCAFFCERGHKKKRKLLDERVKQSNYNFTKVITEPERFALGVCEPERIIAIVRIDKDRILKYEDILGVDLVVNGKMVVSRSLGGLVGAAAIGGVVGAMAVKQTVTNKTTSVYVDIHTRLLEMPNIRLLTFRQSVANEIVGVIKIIIDRLEHEEKAKIFDSKQTSKIKMTKENDGKLPTSIQTVSIAEELSKLADLRSKGILSEEEFTDQKKKLLNQG